MRNPVSLFAVSVQTRLIRLVEAAAAARPAGADGGSDSVVASAGVVAWAGQTAGWLEVAPARGRSIRKPVSLFAVSVQTRSIRVLDAAAAARPAGVEGGSGSVVTLTALELSEWPPVLKARTR